MQNRENLDLWIEYLHNFGPYVLASASDANYFREQLKKAPAPQAVYALRPLAPTPSPRVITASGEMMWPTTCRRISQYFRYRHSGIDIACGFGQEIYAADDGTVERAQGGWNGGYGVMIEIDHGNGKRTLYGHLSSLFVKAG